jgi:hypothetical protein
MPIVGVLFAFGPIRLFSRVQDLKATDNSRCADLQPDAIERRKPFQNTPLHTGNGVLLDPDIENHVCKSNK